MTKRLTAVDYRAEHNHQTTQLAVLEKRIELRFITLCRQHPDVVLYSIPDPNQKVLSIPVFAKDFDARGNRPIAKLDTDARLRFIKVIEQHLADKHPHKQTAIEFPDRDCISDKSPDGKHQYEGDNKYCTHCGFNKNSF